MIPQFLWVFNVLTLPIFMPVGANLTLVTVQMPVYVCMDTTTRPAWTPAPGQCGPLPH